MSWKKFLSLFEKNKPDESHFILGIDIGNVTSCIAFFDTARSQAETIDLSGGYGKPSVPTIMQYIPDTKEWIFGDYAANNMGAGSGITFDSLVERLGRMEYIDVDGKPQSLYVILGIYIRELISNVKNLNPKAEIAGICVTSHSYMGEPARQELMLAFKSAGYEKAVVSFVNDRDCVLYRCLSGGELDLSAGKTLVLDFGGRALRGGVYSAKESHGKLAVNCLSYLFSEELGVSKIDEKMTRLLTRFYCEEQNTSDLKLGKQTKEQLEAFTRVHKDILLRKNLLAKPVKLYYNFVYPPFQKTVYQEDISSIIEPFTETLKSFFAEILEKSLEKTEAHEIKNVLCVGGGFEMSWAKDAAAKVFPDSDFYTFKNPKCAAAEGASIAAASHLKALNGKIPQITVTDPHQMKYDIGICVKSDGKERFVPIIEKNSFWWQRHEPKYLILNESTDKPVRIVLYKRDEQGELTAFKPIVIDSLPNRPKSASRLEMYLECQSYNRFTASVTDKGFGELFPSEGFTEKYAMSCE